MAILDFYFVLQWWLTLFLIGVFFLPVTIYFFESFFDFGYAFSKVIGSIILTYAFFILGILHVISFNKLNPISLILITILIATISNYPFLRNNEAFFTRIKDIIKRNYRVFILQELLFFTALLFWSFIRSFQPDINGLEKFMDFGFVNSALRTEYFPPKDMWFPPFPINYYYFGHLTTAVITKISLLPSYITYNLMLASLFAFTFILTFSIGANIFHTLTIDKQKKQTLSKFNINSFTAGIFSAFLVSFGGNLHSLYAFFKPYDTSNPIFFVIQYFSPTTFPNGYWYPNATRFIYNTIHEFPLYSFVVSDLHGHVLSIPIILTTIALLFSIYKTTSLAIRKMVFLSFLLACAYMTNAWDGAIYFLLTGLIVLYCAWVRLKNKNIRNWLIKSFAWLFFIAACFFIFSFPFSLFFVPPVSGIGILCAPNFLTKLEKIGPFLFEANHCQRSPFWQLIILYGFFYFWVISFIIFILKRKKVSSSDGFILFLIFLSTVLIIIPEFIYLKDIYPAHYRANTMFKLVYESFIMLSISSGYIIIRTFSNFKSSYLKLVYLCIGIIGLFLVFLYPYFAINSYYGNLLVYKGLDGISYLKTKNPSDYETIMWFNKTVRGQPIILEAQGDSYTDYERISAYTGLPTILGWTVHEWLWRKSYDVPAPRIAEVKTMYESEDIEETKSLLRKYHVVYIIIGDLERQKYQNLQEKKFKTLGDVVFQAEKTTVYKIL